MAVNIGPRIGIDGEAEYRKSLQNIIQETKTLDSQMKKLEATFDKEGSSQEKNAAKADLLKQKQEALKNEVDAIQQAVNAATEKFGENSTEALKWEASLAKAETELANVNNELADVEAELEAGSSAFGELSNTISEQQSELNNLKDAYVDAVLEFGEGSDEAQALADQISELSGSLRENQTTLDDAKASADSFDQTLNETTEAEKGLGEGASAMAGLFGGSIGSMAQAIVAGGIAGAMSEMINLAKEVGEYIVDAADQWGDAMAVIAECTGLTNEELEALTQSAANVNGVIANANTSFADTAATMAEINTRFGLTGESAELLTEQIEKYAKATGQTGVEATDDLANIMKQWGLDVSDLPALMDKLTVASQNCQLSAGDLSSVLAENAFQFKELGYSEDEALGLLVAWSDAGVSTNKITTGMQTAIKKLTGATDDVPGTFREALKAIEDSNGGIEVLEQTVGDTGLTISDVFGAKIGQSMVQGVSTGNAAIDDFTAKIKDSNGAVESTYEATLTWRDNWSRVGEDFKNTIGSVIAPAFKDITRGTADLVTGATDANEAVGLMGIGFSKLNPPMQTAEGEAINMMATYQSMGSGMRDSMEETAQQNKEKWENIRSEMYTKMASMKDNAKTKFDEIKVSASSAWDSMKTTVANKFDDIKNTISTKAGEWKTKLEEGVSKLKGVFNFSWSLPPLKLPHFSVSGGQAPWGFGGQGSMPSISVDWYAKAMHNAIVLDSPTIFGMMGNTLLGGGETGREVITGEGHLLDMISASVSNALAQPLNRIDTILQTYLPECAAEKGISINEREFGRVVSRYV